MKIYYIQTKNIDYFFKCSLFIRVYCYSLIWDFFYFMYFYEIFQTVGFVYHIENKVKRKNTGKFEKLIKLILKHENTKNILEDH